MGGAESLWGEASVLGPLTRKGALNPSLLARKKRVNSGGLNFSNLHIPKECDFRNSPWPAPGRGALSLWNVLSDKRPFLCLKPWATWYQFYKIVYVNSVIGGEPWLLLWGTESE